MSKLLDTNILLDHYDSLFDSIEDEVIIHSIVLEELDNILHNSQSEEKKYKARQARNAIKKAKNKKYDTYYCTMAFPVGWDINKNDNKILAVCEDKGYTLITNDLAMQTKAESIGVKWEDFNGRENEEVYLGYKEVLLSDNDLAIHYENPTNKWDLVDGQYLIIRNANGKVIDKQKWTSKGYKNVSRKSMKSIMFGDLKPKDIYQELCFDSLLTDQFTIMTGKQGSGKSLLALMYCMWAIQNNKFDKVIILYNPVKVRGAADSGFFPGNSTEKACQNFIGNMLNTKFGDVSIVSSLIAQDKIQLISMADCRGMEVTDNQILYIPEAQNTSSDLMKICLSRVSENAKCIIEGDHFGQVDVKQFEFNNGLKRAIDVFKGQDFVSYVHLPNIWRSKIGEIADLL